MRWRCHKYTNITFRGRTIQHENINIWGNYNRASSIQRCALDEPFRGAFVFLYFEREKVTLVLGGSRPSVQVAGDARPC